MSKKRRKKGALVLVCILVIACIVLFLLLFFFGKPDSKVIDEIKDYGYTLDERDTQLMRDVFYELKNELENSEIDYEKYAEHLSKLFIIDLYTIDNKLNKYDVGGVEYIYPDHLANYMLKVEDTLYRYLEDKTSRKDKMPEVSKISVTDIESSTFNYADNEYEAYTLNLEWEYKKDLGYDTQGIITLMKVDNKLYVAQYSTEVDK